ncbi:biogenesis of lysosome-related organelles complex 1 subunit 4 [Haematobia irritans]|uniref:biogenesis of lysosome-related organelles complex 1 subunit 4 n=1 Tax=Haematobia irritans TaxID=7368 RepID=UPI003F4FF247
MVEKASEDYSKLLLQSATLEKEINPICMTIEDMITRLDELESLLANVKGESNILIEHSSGILAFESSFHGLKQRIDRLETFINVVDSNVNDAEKSIEKAESELNITDYSIKGLIFKPLLAKTPSSMDTREPTPSPSNYSEHQPIQIFQTSEYFKD